MPPATLASDDAAGDDARTQELRARKARRTDEDDVDGRVLEDALQEGAKTQKRTKRKQVDSEVEDDDSDCDMIVDEDYEAERTQKQRRREKEKPAKKHKKHRAGAGPSAGFGPAVENVNPLLSGKGLAGQIKRVRVIHFMCHENFVVDFGPYLNFVCGSNGSGKSSVLAAIQICTGATARDTRGSAKLCDLIMYGHDKATALVELWNTGTDAYRPEVFGEVIGIRRTIKRSGASGTSTVDLLDANGNVAQRSVKVAELTQMLNALNVDGANPVQVLTQTTAKELLIEGDQAKLYQLWQSAMQIPRIREDIAHTYKQMAAVKEAARGMEGELAEAEADKRALKKKVVAMETALEAHKRRADIEKAFRWEAVMQCRKKVEQCGARVGEAEAIIEKIDAKKVEIEAAISKYEDSTRAADRELKQLAEENKSRDTRSLLKERTDLGRKRQNAEGKAKRIREREADLQFQINCFEQNRERDNAERNARIEAAKRRAVELRHSHEAALQRMREAVQAAEQRRQEVARARGDAQSADADVARQKQVLTDLRKRVAEEKAASGGNINERCAPHGQGRVMRAIVEDAARAHGAGRLRQPAIGPLGRFLSVDDERWLTAAESVLKFTMFAFVVDNDADRRALMQIAKTHFRGGLPHWFQIYQTSFNRPAIDVTSRDAVPQHLRTLMQVLHVDEAALRGMHAAGPTVVRNMLIDQCRAERVVLAESEEEATHWAFRSPEARRRVINSVYTAEAQFSLRGVVESRRQLRPDERQNKLAVGAPGQVDVQQVIARLEHQVRGEEGNLRAAQERARAAQGAEKQRAADLRAAEAAARQANDAEARLRVELEDGGPEEQAGPAAGEDDDAGALLQLERDLDAARLERGRVEEEIREIETSVEALQGTIQGLMKELATRKEAMSKLQERYEEELNMQNQWRTRLAKAEKARGEKEADLRERRKTLERMSRTCEGLERQAAAACGEAEGVAAMERCKAVLQEGQRGSGSRGGGAGAGAADALDVDKKLELLQRRQAGKVRAILAEAGVDGQNLHENEGEVERLLRRTQAKHIQAKMRHSELADTLKDAMEPCFELEHTVAAREEKLEQQIVGWQQLCTNKFSDFIKRRGHKGSLGFDDDAGMMTVEVTIKGQNKAATELKTLSGGERSYTSLSLILSMGELVDAGFYALDEFDVFLDAQNRRIAIGNIIHFVAEMAGLGTGGGVPAWMGKNVQMLLLSPQKMSAIEDARNAWVNKYNGGKPLPDSFIHMWQLQPPRER
ncbi:unnamed protein product [Pedinophyceae sp. YPF-701]|nr:unnamed protein product [Pedinophyceae sp. YPF-701]